MAYTYIVECSDGTYYTGWTADLQKRLNSHNTGNGAKYTRGRAPVKLVYSEWHPDKCKAQQRECEIKQLSRKNKQKLINSRQEVY